MKNRFLITGLATATILSAAALNQLSHSVYAEEATATTEQPVSVMGTAGSTEAKPTASTTEKTEVEKAKEAQATATSGGISDNDTIPAGTSVVFSGAIANSTTYKEFRQTNAYKTIATNYVGFNATNAEIKACLEWLIQKGKEGYQALPSTEEYRSAFGR